MDDITKEVMRAILDDADGDSLRVDCTMVITLRKKSNPHIRHELEVNMQTHELISKNGDLIFIKPRVRSYTHRRYNN